MTIIERFTNILNKSGMDMVVEKSSISHGTATMYGIKKDSPYSLKIGVIKDESKINVEIEKSGETVESYDADFEDTADLDKKISTAVDTYSTIASADYVPGEDDSEDDEILVEDPIDEPETGKYSNVPAGLLTVKDMAKKVGDELKAISDMTNDTEIIAIIMDLANSAFALALDIEDATDTYNELQGEESEEDFSDDSLE